MLARMNERAWFPSVDHVVDGRYELRELLGVRGHVALYRAHHTVLDRELLFRALAGTESNSRHLLSDAANFSYEPVPTEPDLVDVGRTAGPLLYHAFEWRDGYDWRTLLGERLPGCGQA